MCEQVLPRTVSLRASLGAASVPVRAESSRSVLSHLPGQALLRILFVYYFQVGYPGWRGWVARMVFARKVRTPAARPSMSFASQRVAQPA